MLTVMGMQLMMSRPVGTTVHDLRVFMLVRHRDPSTTAAAPRGSVAADLVVLVHSSRRAAISSGVSQGQCVVRPRRVLLLGTTVAGITGIRFKRNVLQERQIRLSNCGQLTE